MIQRLRRWWRKLWSHRGHPCKLCGEETYTLEVRQLSSGIYAMVACVNQDCQGVQAQTFADEFVQVLRIDGED